MDDSIEYSELSILFKAVLDHHRPDIEEKLPTFQSIAGYPNHENVISNLYQFFLEDNHHELQDLFLSALDDCVSVDQDLTMDYFEVIREYPSQNGGRIDIVIKEVTEGDDPSKVIIIENKIHHILDNDLVDYWSTFNGIDHRIGIVLTLQPIPVKLPFINITHQEWIARIRDRLGVIFTRAHPKYLMLLQDFIDHIDSFYKTTFDMSSYKFLFEKGEDIKALHELKVKGIEALAKDLGQELPSQSTWEWSRAIPSGVTLQYTSGAMVLYVYFNEIFASKEFTLDLWIKGSEYVSVWKSNEYSNMTKQISQSRDIKLLDQRQTKEWGQVGNKSYSINSATDLSNFASLVLGAISTDWNDLAQSIYRSLQS